MKNKKNQKSGFAFTESLTAEDWDNFRDRHFQQVLHELGFLERWLKSKKIKNQWTLTEKLAFLRNVEAMRRTGAAIRRTQLSWVAFLLGLLVGLLGLAVGLNF